MSCNCNVLNSKLDRLRTKYAGLKKEHRKLLDFTVTLTDALEAFVRGGVSNKLLTALETCSSLHPDFLTRAPPRPPPEENPISENGTTNEKESIHEAATTESEREYYEGFSTRPRIPRTPQRHPHNLRT